MNDLQFFCFSEAHTLHSPDKDDLKLMRPRLDDGHESEEYIEEKEPKKQPIAKEPEPKAFYDDWGDVDFNKKSPEKPAERQKENHIVEETFERFGLTNL